jgi:hypothetical protein
VEQEEGSVRNQRNEEDKSETSVHVGRRPEEELRKTTWSKEGLKYFHKVERTWQEAYSNKEQMCALINGWERWEPDGDLKKGKELLSINWRIVEMNKKAKGRREGGEDDNDDG